MELHTIVSGITLPNDRSVALHEKFGFIKVAQFPEIGYKMDQWLDVGYWSLSLKNEFPKEEI
jgi:phosphinothricin acetyltransferase